MSLFHKTNKKQNKQKPQQNKRSVEPSLGADIHDIGARMRAERMKRGISIKMAAIQSNLNVEIVEKIEENRFGEIGAAVFVRDHIMRYARYLNMDCIALLHSISSDEYMLQIPAYETETETVASSVDNKKERRVLRLKQAWCLSVVFVTASICVLLLVESFGTDTWLVDKVKMFIDYDTTASPIKMYFFGQEKEQSGEINPASAKVEPVEEEKEIDDGIVRPKLQKNSQQVSKTLAPVDANSAAIISFSGRSWLEVYDKNNRSIVSTLKQKDETFVLSSNGSPYRVSITRPEFVSVTVRGEVVPIDALRSKNNFREIIIDLKTDETTVSN
ncbi:MAG: DUF4115 domain-containing protein [Cardiobacteriaceae bacterium]|nr:DUF4115 domain-containing protein [Cardiobacteriaceae bacterium]